MDISNMPDMAREIAKHAPAGGIGLHGSTWEKAESIKTLGLVVDKSKQDELFMYITSGDREALDAGTAAEYASAYAVARGIKERLFSSLEEAANRSEDILPEADLPTISIFFSDDRYRFNQMFTLEVPDRIAHASKASSTEHDVPARLVRGAVRLEASDIRAALQTSQETAKTTPMPDHTLMSDAEIDGWLRNHGIEKTTRLAQDLFSGFSTNGGTLIPAEAAQVIESGLFQVQCTKQLSARVILETYHFASTEETPNI